MKNNYATQHRIQASRKFPSKLFPITNLEETKPSGGLWSSSFIPKKKYASQWMEFIQNEGEMFYGESFSCFVFDIDSNANIFEITWSKDIRTINWAKLSKDYDGVHSNGLFWDVESTCLFNLDVIRNVTPIVRRKTKTERTTEDAFEEAPKELVEQIEFRSEK